MKNISYPPEFIEMFRLKQKNNHPSLFDNYRIVGTKGISKANHTRLILRQNAKEIKEYLIGFIIIQILEGHSVKKAIENFYEHTNISEIDYSEESLLQTWNRYISKMRKTYNLPFQKKSL